MEANAKWFEEEILTREEKETEAAGEAWAVAQAQAGVLSGCLILDGPLGAGKTAWVRGFCRGWKCQSPVASPTFSLVQEYRGGKSPVYHLDFYRLQQEEEVWGLGWEEILTHGWALVEWGLRFPGVLPQGAWLLRFFLQPEGRLLRWKRFLFPEKGAAL